VEIAILIFDGITALDAVGPYEVLHRLPGVRTRFVAAQSGPRATHEGSLAMVATHSLKQVVAPDVLVVPGGPGARGVMADPAVLAWVAQVHETSTWTTSVCTGSLILAAAGLLDGVDATSHHLAFDELAALGAVPVAERVVVRGRIITSGGVLAGIDMALHLAELVSGADVANSIRDTLEYEPPAP